MSLSIAPAYPFSVNKASHVHGGFNQNNRYLIYSQNMLELYNFKWSSLDLGLQSVLLQC